ncbi:MAG: hypothetical protein KC434_00170 [Anaerolineales bacterium]|nr:hypothetical protein [Anaerolineales bacterium]
MKDREELEEKLIDLLAEIDFDKRYYEFYQSMVESEDSDTSLTRADFEATLVQTTLDFNYHKKENFFQHKQSHPNADMALHIAFPYRSMAEFILTVNTAAGPIGGPFPQLARQVGLRRDPDFSPSPRSPKLPFADEYELEKVIKFGIDLFEHAKTSILSYDGWR